MDEKKVKILITIGGILFSIIVIAFVLGFNKSEGTDNNNDDKKNKEERIEKYDKYKGIIVKIDDTKKLWLLYI